MTLLADRPIETAETRTAEQGAHSGDAYVTTHALRPATAGSYVTIELSGFVAAGAIRGRYVSVTHAPPTRQTEGRYTDRG